LSLYCKSESSLFVHLELNETRLAIPFDGKVGPMPVGDEDAAIEQQREKARTRYARAEDTEAAATGMSRYARL
jgi:hypothetical protein